MRQSYKVTKSQNNTGTQTGRGARTSAENEEGLGARAMAERQRTLLAKPDKTRTTSGGGGSEGQENGD